MDYVARAPDPPLAALIDDVYLLSGTPRHRRLNVPPMPSAHLFLNLGEPVRLYDSDPGVPAATLTDAWFLGLSTRRFIIEYPTSVRLAGVHFKPWGLAPFVDVSLSDLRDQWVPADAVWGPAVHRLRDQIAQAPSPWTALQVVEDELRARRVPEPPRHFDLVNHTAGRLESSWGSVGVRALTDSAGVSATHLASQFKGLVGITPKRLARIYRFARLILSVDAAAPVDWSGLAQTAGYFDQAHLGKEFKDFTGLTPTGYLALRRRLPAAPGFPPDLGPMPAD
ncbi:AraC family transcriptional regulator [Occultella glacieicola]|uniref:AraC family transcriptional regulator n=1 Tax=Occultella glacieicola TaxID=2518684 RepID=A0ABY2DZ36_9MICO|nr:helix-turn-helix domain-containing protein [Occultella glacieicola]TDE89176.1 AraC family transcriptional regulator [Occultella glacieicola]